MKETAMETPLVDQKVQDTVSGRSPYWDMVDFARQLERDRAELVSALRPFAAMRLSTETGGSVLSASESKEVRELMEWRDKPIREARALLARYTPKGEA